MTRYQLMTKAVGAPAADAPTAANPAMLRQGSIPIDPGRQWAGDLYTSGAVTSPDNAFAHFTLPDGTEAWMDRNVDGSLIGWVKDGTDIYRYNDADAWALDVDGAQMTRVDNSGPEVDTDADTTEPGEAPVGGGTGTADTADTTGTPAPPPAPDPAAAPNMTTPADEPGEAFDKEPDPAGDAVDPEVDPDAKPILDPKDLPEPDDGEEYDNPFADPSEDNGDVAGDQPESKPKAPKEKGPGPDVDDEDENAASEDPESSTKNEDEDGKPKGKAKKPTKKLFGGKVQMKHLPGEHNQADHGNWADPGHTKPDDAGSSTQGSGPKSLTKEQLARLTTDQLNSIAKPDSGYTESTKLGAAAEVTARRGKSRTGRHKAE